MIEEAGEMIERSSVVGRRVRRSAERERERGMDTRMWSDCGRYGIQEGKGGSRISKRRVCNIVSQCRNERRFPER